MGKKKEEEKVNAERGYIFQEANELLKRAQVFERKNTIQTSEATFRPKPEYPGLPINILLATDLHYGSIHTDYERLAKDLETVENTPNTYMVLNGDEVDNFNQAMFPSGMNENPLPPQLQTLAIMDKLRQLSAKGKIGVMSFGNHNDFADVSGYDWYNTFCKELKNAVFPYGGFLHILHGKQHYGLALTHRYWGTSKLNPTNACKRFWEHQYPQADLVFLGHTHQSEQLSWERGGKKRIGVIGGTYKLEDTYARKRGIGGRGGQPGHSVLFFPGEHKMVGISDFETANQIMLALVFQEERKKVA